MLTCVCAFPVLFSLSSCDNLLLVNKRKGERLGLPYLSPYLDSMGSNFSHEANFATAGSTIRPQNTTMSQSGYSPISLDVQFVQYSDFQRRSQIICKQGTNNCTILNPGYKKIK
ncbi:GDSL esterase/lipase [Abeliophyllum distichum]|uniref:GDSL esterase/lipase n=1 Tax=Abeliophyllum distichum TaxID=126358 RepID=A0ABD1R1G8_9LAMI